MGISEQTSFRRKKKYGGLNISELRRLRQLEEENRNIIAFPVVTTLVAFALWNTTEVVTTRIRHLSNTTPN
jgi:hypothetical protein